MPCDSSPGHAPSPLRSWRKWQTSLVLLGPLRDSLDLLSVWARSPHTWTLLGFSDIKQSLKSFRIKSTCAGNTFAFQSLCGQLPFTQNPIVAHDTWPLQMIKKWWTQLGSHQLAHILSQWILKWLFIDQVHEHHWCTESSNISGILYALRKNHLPFVMFQS